MDKEVTRFFPLGLMLILCSFLTMCEGQTGKSKDAGVELQPSGNASEENKFIYAPELKSIHSIDTSAGWFENGPKILLTGTVYQIDARTPARDVVLYYYHTDQKGRYIHKPSEERSMPPNEKGQTHGYLRGWVKTDFSGKYFIYTVMPGAYPTGNEPAHIHMTVREPNEIREYYIDDFVFDNDKLLTSSRRAGMENRCGSGVLRMVQKSDLLVGERNLILGMNIPDYPDKATVKIKSGINVGDDVPSFTPYHAWGPDKGTRTCPVCKYGWYHGILYYVGDKSDWNEIKRWLSYLEKESIKREKYLKVYLVYGNPSQYDKKDRELALRRIGEELKLKKVALTFVPSFSDHESDVDLHHIDPDAENTFILYKRSRVIDKYINIKPTQQDFDLINKRLDETVNEYFDLPKPERN